MTRIRTAAGSLLFAVGQPGLVAGVIPYWITGGSVDSSPALALRVAGGALLGAGLGPANRRPGLRVG